MNHNIIERNERLQKVSEALPPLPPDTLVVNDYTNALNHLAGERWNIYTSGKVNGQPVPPILDEGYSAAVVRLSTNKDQLRMILSLLNSVLKESAQIWIIGANDEGIKSFPKTAKGYVDDVDTIDIRQRARLLQGVKGNQKATLADWIELQSIQLNDQSIEWRTFPGVFNKGQLDAGTAYLLSVLAEYPIKRTFQLADFACGSGVIARWLADRFPEAQIDSMDADSWALELAKLNAPTVKHRLVDGWIGMPRDCRYDLVISNPPVHIGKESDYTVLNGLIKDAKLRLHYRGQILMVTLHHIPVQRLAEEAEYRIIEVVAHNNRYKVWRLANHN